MSGHTGWYAAKNADTLANRISPGPAAATLNRKQGRAVPRLEGMGREITNLPMLRQVIDIGIENRQCSAHRSVIQKGKGFTNGRDKAIEKDRFQKAT